MSILPPMLDTRASEHEALSAHSGVEQRRLATRRGWKGVGVAEAEHDNVGRP